MLHLSPLAKAQHAIRGAVCTDCRFRPTGSETLGPHERRTCEEQCPIFTHLATLRQVIRDVHAPSLGAYEAAVTDRICQACTLSDTAGDYCSRWSTRQCPLSLYLTRVVDVLERLDRRAQSA